MDFKEKNAACQTQNAQFAPSTPPRKGLLFETELLDVSFCENLINLGFHAAHTAERADLAEKFLCLVSEILTGNQSPLSEETSCLARINLAELYYNKFSRYDEAEAILRSTLHSIQDTIGLRHCYTALLFANLGELKVKQGHRAKALTYYKLSCATFESITLDNFRTLSLYASVASDYADLLSKAGNPKLSKTTSRRAETIKAAAAAQRQEECQGCQH